MAVRTRLPAKTLWPIVLLMAVQVLCVVYFIIDVVIELRPLGWTGLQHFLGWSEVLATFALILGVAFEAVVLWRLMQTQKRMQQSLDVASGALSDLLNGYFVSWGLTPTEQDVASFTIKGFSIPEIAEFRGSAEGTIKTHLNAIYRKSGVTGRAQLISVLVEDLFQTPLMDGAAPSKRDDPVTD